MLVISRCGEHVREVRSLSVYPFRLYKDSEPMLINQMNMSEEHWEFYKKHIVGYGIFAENATHAYALFPDMETAKEGLKKAYIKSSQTSCADFEAIEEGYEFEKAIRTGIKALKDRR